MGAVEPEVFEGRNPFWREAWEGQLSLEDRRKVTNAVKWGRRVDEARLVPYVYGLIAISRRSLRWMIPAFVGHLGLVAAWVYFACGLEGFAPCWFWLPFALVLLVVGTVGLLLRIRLLRRAEEHNTRAG